MVMVDLVRAGRCQRDGRSQLPCLETLLPAKIPAPARWASEQRDKTCAVALDPAGELELEQDRSYYAG